MRYLPSAIGFRYAHARRGSQFIGLNAILAIVGIAIGIAALIVVLSVMNGVMSQVRDRILAMYAHASLRSYINEQPISRDFDPTPYLAHVEGVRAWAPYVQGQGLIGDSQSFQGVVIQGINPEKEGEVSSVFAELAPEVKQSLVAGSWNVIIGEGMQRSLGVEIGDRITVIVPQITASAAGLLPRMKRFTVSGVFKSGHYQFDNSLLWTHIDDAAVLMEVEGTYTGYHIMVDNPLEAPRISEAIQPTLPFGMYASNWSRENASYFNAVQLEKNAMFIILCLIVVVAAFGLLSSMYMVVNEKRRDIAILRTMGMTRGQIRQIFLTQGLTFGGLGMLIGVVLGITISLYVPDMLDFLQKRTGFSLSEEMYFISELSVKIDPVVVVGISLVTLFFTLLFSVIPAQIAAKTEPARALSHE